jgi:hypothetical protein
VGIQFACANVLAIVTVEVFGFVQIS